MATSTRSFSNGGPGTRGDVDALLQQWWAGRAESGDEARAGSARMRSASKKKTKARPAPDSAAGNGASDEGEDDSPGYDHVQKANDIKERDDFAVIETKVLHKPAIWPKAQLVLWAADTALSSGDIHRTLLSLDTTSRLPAISTSLKENGSKLTRTGARARGGTVVRYKLTGAARKEFETWLKAKDKSAAAAPTSPAKDQA